MYGTHGRFATLGTIAVHFIQTLHDPTRAGAKVRWLIDGAVSD
jgi:hypothetical protein